jgi:FkbM family methyltransferase
MKTVPFLLLFCFVCVLLLHIYPLILHRNCTPHTTVLPDVSVETTPADSLEELLHSPQPCDQVFLDIGSNIGNHVRFLFEPQLFPRADYPKHFARYFSQPTTKHTCAVGFEANPSHWRRLDQLSSAYNKKGWPTKFLHKAVSDKDGFVKFYRQGDENYNEWGFSIQDTHRSKRTAVLIPTVDLAEWMRRYIRPTQTVLMKMDIEGSEYVVLSNLLLKSGSIVCSSVRVITIEYHPSAAPAHFKSSTAHFHDFVSLLMRHSNQSCNTVVEEKDDESYVDNNFALP